MEGMTDLLIKKYGTHYDGQSAAGWHAVLRDAEGKYQSLSGPHFSWLMAKIEGQNKLKGGKE